MLPVLQIGSLALPLPPLLLLLGFWLGLEWTERHAAGFGVQAEKLYRMVLAALLAGIVGARLGYALQSPQAFLDSPLSLLSLRPEMLDAQGGLLAGGLAALIYGQRQKMPLWSTLDALTTLFAILGVTLGLSHFASGDAFGAPARLPWSIFLWGELRHPSQVYEALAASGIAALVWPGSLLDRRMAWKTQPGNRFWAFAALTAGATLFLEAFRGDSTLLVERFRLVQVMAWGVLALSLWRIRLSRESRHNTPSETNVGRIDGSDSD
jgi:phosphatidylglycerol---prolipoprotein diacylglyceryl transferase